MASKVESLMSQPRSDNLPVSEVGGYRRWLSYKIAMGSDLVLDIPGETFRVLKGRGEKQYDEFCTKNRYS